MPTQPTFAASKSNGARVKASPLERQQLEARKEELARRRGSLVRTRAKLSARFNEIEKQLTQLGEDSSSGRGDRNKSRMMGVMLVKEQLDLELKLVVEDQAIHDLDFKRLEVDQKLFALEKSKFEKEHPELAPLEASKVANLKGEKSSEVKTGKKSKSKGELALEKDLLEGLEPQVITYWGKKRLALTEQVLKTRENRLKLWQDEITAHKEFLETKKEDAESGKKRAALRQKQLKSYFRLREARQRLNSELIMAENEAWQASERMKYELGSVYRRLAYLNRLGSSKKSEQISLSSSKYDLGPEETLRVGEYGTGIVFDDLFNWGSRVKEVADGSAAQEKGIQSGDEVVVVDGSPVLGSERGFRSLLRGPKDKEIELTVSRQGRLYTLPLELTYRPEEKTHPEILKSLNKAKESNDSEAFVAALLEEIEHKTKYSRSNSVADSSVEELVELLQKDKDAKKLSPALKLKAYARCSAHNLRRMSEEISRTRKSGAGESANYLNQADEYAEEALKLSSDSQKGDLAMAVELLELANQYRKQYDFRHIGTADTLKKVCDRAVAATLASSEQSLYDSGNILGELSEIYELTLKDNKKAAEVLKASLEAYLKVIPEEAKEVTTTRLALSRNYSHLKDYDAAVKTLEDRLATIERIQSYSKKSREYSMYDYVTSLKELGKLYPSQKDYKKALAAATKILAVYSDLEALEDDTFNEALFLSGKSSLKTGKVKQSVTYLTDALAGLDKWERTSCLIDLASAYQKLKKPDEVRLISVVLKENLSRQLNGATTSEAAKRVGDLSVEAAGVLEQIDEKEDSITFMDLALQAYSNSIALKTGDNIDSDSGKKELKELALHFVNQLKKLEPVLESAGRSERLAGVKKLSDELNAKISSEEDLDAEWLVRVPKEI